MLRTVNISSALATNSVAADTAVSLDAAVTENGIEFPSFEADAVVCIQLDAGSTPGAYDILVQESDASDGTFTTVLALDENSTTGTTFHNVTFTKAYARVNVTDATANAGTISADVLLAG